MLTIIADNLPRFMVCNGSRLMEAAYPREEQDNTIRDEGNAAHHMANAVFKNEFTLEELIDRKAPNGSYMSAEMSDHVAEYLSALDCGDTEVDTSFGIPGAWQINGRCDHYSFSGGVVTIDDLKYGYTIVEPEMNWTLIAHALGICSKLNVEPHEIVLRIHQPRAYHPDGPLREWRISYARLMELYATLTAALVNPSDMLVTSREHCRRCYALATCPAARAADMNAIDATAIAMPDDMSGEALSHYLDTIATAEAQLTNRLTALKELATYRLKQGAVIPNYATETRYAHTRWKTGLTAEFLSMASGTDLAKPGLVTPAEAKRRGMSETVIASLTERPQTGVKLVRVTAAERAKRLLKKG